MQKFLLTVFTLVATLGYSADIRNVTWIKTSGGDWDAAVNWENGDAPVGDGLDYAIMLHTNTTTQSYAVYLGDTRRVVYGIYSASRPVYKYGGGVWWWRAGNSRGGTLAIGAGGYKTGETGGLAPRFYCNVELTASQTWQFNDGCNWFPIFYDKSLLSEADVVWTIAAGTNENPVVFSSGDSAGFNGSVRVNGAVNFDSMAQINRLGSKGVEFFNTFEEGVLQNPYIKAALTSSGTFSFNTPVMLNLAGGSVPFSFKICLPDNKGSADNNVDTWDNYMTNHWAGVAGDAMLQFVGIATTYMQPNYIDPYEERFYFGANNTGLVATAGNRIAICDWTLRLAHTNALGTGNALAVRIGPNSGTGDRGHAPNNVAGLLAADDMTVASDIYVWNNSRAGPMIALLGGHGKGTALFTGTVSNNPVGANDHALQLVSLSNGVVRFTGAFNGFDNGNPVEIVGGSIEWSGDNTGLKQGLSVRAGRLILASPDAAGNGTIVLGGTVPEVANVRCYTGHRPVTATANYVAASGTTPAYYKPAGSSWMIDGITLVTGDRVLVNYHATAAFNSKYNGIFELHDDTYLYKVADVTYTNNLRVQILEGDMYGGRVFRQMGSSCFYATEYCSADPGAAVLARNGITITNTMHVTDNKSAGKSVIGVGDDSVCVFTGTIKLAKDVTLEAAANGTADFISATFSDTNELKHGIGFQGAGMVKVTTDQLSGHDLKWKIGSTVATADISGGTLDLTGRTLTVITATGDIDIESSPYVLARGSFTGIPTVVGLTGGWKLAVRAGELILHCPPPATVMIVK